MWTFFFLIYVCVFRYFALIKTFYCPYYKYYNVKFPPPDHVWNFTTCNDNEALCQLCKCVCKLAKRWVSEEIYDYELTFMEDSWKNISLTLHDASCRQHCTLHAIPSHSSMTSRDTTWPILWGKLAGMNANSSCTAYAWAGTGAATCLPLNTHISCYMLIC